MQFKKIILFACMFGFIYISCAIAKENSAIIRYYKLFYNHYTHPVKD